MKIITCSKARNIVDLWLKYTHKKEISPMQRRRESRYWSLFFYTNTSGDLTLTPRLLSVSLFGRVTSEASDTGQVHTENRTLWPCEVGKPCNRKSQHISIFNVWKTEVFNTLFSATKKLQSDFGFHTFLAYILGIRP